MPRAFRLGNDANNRSPAKPICHWMMQKFQGIPWVNLDGRQQISNLNDQRRLIVPRLGLPVERYYHVPD